MPKINIDKTDWDLITKRIQQGRCVPFLGAGVNVSSKGYEGLPLGPAVARKIAESLTGTKLAPFKELAEVKDNDALAAVRDLVRHGLEDLPRVSFLYQRAYDYPDLMELLVEELNRACDPSPLLKTLAPLPFKLIITTNYDRLMEQALDEAGREFITVVQPADGFDEFSRAEVEDRLADRGDKLILYKIHGSFDENGDGPGSELSRIVVTEEDYIEFLAIARTPDAGVPELVITELAGSTLLFLGYSLEDWDLRTLFKGLVESLPTHRRRRSFAVQLKPAEFWVKFWAAKEVDIFDADVYAFARQLQKELDKRVSRDG
jgi:hypothetical protein